MEENNNLMSEQEFSEHLENSLNLRVFDGVRKYKSILRAFRRGDVTTYGFLVPHKPFNNRGNSCRRPGHHSRKINEEKKRIYARLRGINN